MAGGRGTRFWPKSRKARPKQLLPIVGDTSLLRQTIDRIAPLVPAERTWILTSAALRKAVAKELPEVPTKQIIAEPAQRNTAPCIALAARLIAQVDPDATMAVLPSDHHIAKPTAFRKVIRAATKAAASGELFVFGLPPAWAHTGYGYIEFPAGTKPGDPAPIPVKRFREKPKLPAAKRFVKAGNFFWNSGMFVWRTDAILEAVSGFLPKTAKALNALPALGKRSFAKALADRYPDCENISIDFGVLEKANNIAGFACPDLGWSDVGAWDAVYALRGSATENVVALDSARNLVDAPGKTVALIGVEDLVVVDTPDALLVCPRSRAQDVGKLVKQLEASGKEELL